MKGIAKITRLALGLVLLAGLTPFILTRLRKLAVALTPTRRVNLRTTVFGLKPGWAKIFGVCVRDLPRGFRVCK
jgi:hypothetical protein